MRKIATMVVVGTIAAVLQPAVGDAVEKQLGQGSNIIMKVGNKVHLLYGGSGDMKKEMCPGDLVPVYREIQSGGHVRVRQVGQVKIVSYMDDKHMEAQVVDGEVKPGDVVKKNGASCTIEQP